jgi:MFS family permease
VPSTATSASSNVEGQWTYPGWRVVAAAHLGVMVSFGSLLVFTFGIFLKPLTAEFHWSREEASRAFALAAMTIALVSPFLGLALDRFGPRRVVLPCFLMFGASVLALSGLSGSLWQLYAIFIAIGVAGNGTTQMGYSGAVTSWFDRRRGLALSIVLAGVGIGSILHPILAEHWIATYGWRTAYRIFGILILLLGVPLTALWVRRNPAALPRTSAESGATLRQALRQREFWILVAVLFLSSAAANGTLTHLSAHLTDRGVSAAHAALTTGLLGVANLGGRLLTGWLLDRFSGTRLSLGLLLAMAAGLLLLSQSSGLVVASFAVVLIGFGLGGESDITPYLLTRYFGLRSFSALYGLTWTFYAFAGALGPVIFGRVFDTTGSYAALLRVAGAVTGVSGLLMLAMRPARR